MKKLLLILLIFSGSTFAMEKLGVYKAVKKPEPTLTNKNELGQKLLSLFGKLRHVTNITQDDMKRINDLIAQKANVNYGDDIETILMAATTTDNPQVVQLILSQDPDIYAKVKNFGDEVLSYYIRHTDYGQSDPIIIKLLIEHGAHINSRDIVRQTPLIIAARMGFPETVRLLLEGTHNVAKLHQLRSEERGRSYLGRLPQELITQTAQYLEKADPNLTDILGKTALNYAINQLAAILNNPENFGNVNQRIKNYEAIINMLEPVTTKK